MLLSVGTKRYGRFHYEVETGPLTARKFTAALVKYADTYRAYSARERAFA